MEYLHRLVEDRIQKAQEELRQLLHAAIDPETRRELRRELNLVILDFNRRRTRAVSLDLPQI